MKVIIIICDSVYAHLGLYIVNSCGADILIYEQIGNIVLVGAYPLTHTRVCMRLHAGCGWFNYFRGPHMIKALVRPIIDRTFARFFFCLFLLLLYVCAWLLLAKQHSR